MLVTHDEQQLSMRVRTMSWEAEGVLSVQLQQVDGQLLPPWRPGAHLDLHLPEVITRQYSLCSDPADRSVWRIAVLRERESKGGSQAVHERLRPGDVVEVVGPRNNFPLVDSPEYLFVAGGIGITPILPMIKAAAASGARWSLAYGGRSRASMAFLPELATLGGAVRIYPQDEVGLLDLDAVLGSARDQVKIYCCGPEPLLAAVEDRCTAWPRGALHVERFGAKPRAAADPDAEIAFQVVLNRSGTNVEVPAGKAILECLEAAGVFPLNSCREGICGTCETAVLEGVPDHRDSLLSDDERAANDTMMICVGRALSDRLVLDL